MVRHSTKDPDIKCSKTTTGTGKEKMVKYINSLANDGIRFIKHKTPNPKIKGLKTTNSTRIWIMFECSSIVLVMVIQW